MAKTKLQSSTGMAHISATFNNTIVTITTIGGDTIVQKSAGQHQSGARKKLGLAGEQAAKEAAKAVVAMGMTAVYVKVNGPGHGRDAAVKGLDMGGLKILTISDTTGVPFNGCRPPKEKRV